MPAAVLEAPWPDGEGGTVPAVNEEVSRPDDDGGMVPAVNEAPSPDEPAPAAVNEAPRPDMARGTEKTRPRAMAELGGAAAGETSRLEEGRRPSGPAELGPAASSWENGSCWEPEVGALLCIDRGIGGGEGVIFHTSPHLVPIQSHLSKFLKRNTAAISCCRRFVP